MRDLDEFFNSDYYDYQHQLMGKTYVFLEKELPTEVVCAFTVSNASIFTNYLPNARKKKIGKDVPSAKRDPIHPAVLIGRLGVNANVESPRGAHSFTPDGIESEKYVVC